jgi:hypothetical protein
MIRKALPRCPPRVPSLHRQVQSTLRRGRSKSPLRPHGCVPLDRLARSMKQLIEPSKTCVARDRVSQPDRSPRHNDSPGVARFSHVWGVGGIRASAERFRATAHPKN